MKTKKIIFGLILLTFMMLSVGCGNNKEVVENSDPNKTKLLSGKHYVEMVVKDTGTIKLELDADIAPITVTNFVDLVNNNFYDGLTFHRIISGFMIQGGAKQDGSEYGRTIKGEFSANGITNNISHVRGVISMARSNSYNSASSQFFIVHQDSLHLDGYYASFGKVIEGMEVVDKIAENTIVEANSNGKVLKENQPIIESVRVIDNN